MKRPRLDPFLTVAILAAALLSSAGRVRADGASTRPADRGPNLLTDGGFESVVGASGAPAGWSQFWSRDPGAGSASVDSIERHDGGKSLRVQSSGKRDWAVNSTQIVSVTAGDILTISGWAKSRESAEAQLCVTTRDAGGKVLDWSFGSANVPPGHDWREISRAFLVPAGCVSVQPRFIGVGAGVYWLDDVALRRQGNVAALAAKLKGKQVSIENATLSVVLEAAEGTIAVTDKRTGRRWEQKPIASDGVVTAANIENGAITLGYWNVGDDLRLTARFALASDRPEIEASVEGDGPMPEPVAFPRPFVTGAGGWLIVPMNEGISYPVEDASVEPMTLVTYGGHGLCMSWYGVVAASPDQTGSGGAGVMTIVQTPDDADVKIDRRPGTGLFIQPRWEPTRGRFGYARKLDWVFFDSGGYPAMASRYRAYAESRGLVKTLAQKQREVPAVDLLLGAVNVWNWDMDKPALCREMKSLGMNRVLWSSGGKPDEIDAINGLGYLTSRYDIYQDVWPPGKPAWADHEGWPGDLVLLPDGSPMKGWAHVQHNPNGSVTVFEGGVVCSTRQVERARQRIPADLKTHAYRCRFIDTTTASPFRECYNPDHPLTRGQDREWKMRLLDVCAKENHLVVGSETGIDPAVPYASYFEGMMSLGPYRLPDAGRDMLKYKAPTPDFLKYQVGEKYRIPLWELVYHDCVVADWYWGDYNNKVPEVWDRRDLFNILYATPPMFMFDSAGWAKNKQRFVRSYNAICPLVRRLAHERMTSHEFLTPDHAVQRTSWSDGTRIEVNFGSRPWAAPAGPPIASLGYRVEAGPTGPAKP